MEGAEIGPSLTCGFPERFSPGATERPGEGRGGVRDEETVSKLTAALLGCLVSPASNPAR
jgi:hypothetical protein